MYLQSFIEYKLDSGLTTLIKIALVGAVEVWLADCMLLEANEVDNWESSGCTLARFERLSNVFARFFTIIFNSLISETCLDKTQ